MLADVKPSIVTAAPFRRLVGGALVFLLTVVAGCASSPPKNPDDLCSVFEEKRDWYRAAEAASKRWGAPVQVPMAMMYQESSFKGDARPPMRYMMGFVPVGRASSAYGYSQAKTPSWKDYQRETGNGWADRDDFADAIDFMQWYIYKTNKVNGVSKWDAYGQYLNYHEGWTGYRRGSYHGKQWLSKVARRVDERAKRYGAQYQSCKKDLDRGWLRRVLFSDTAVSEGSGTLLAGR